jgi:hypothetical protein
MMLRPDQVRYVYRRLLKDGAVITSCNKQLYIRTMRYHEHSSSVIRSSGTQTGSLIDVILRYGVRTN